MTTIDIIKHIGNNHKDICYFYFYPLNQQVLLQERIKMTDKVKVHYEKALCIREKYRLPFWDSIMLTMFDNESFSSEIFQAALLHINNEKLYKLPNDEKLDLNLKKLQSDNWGWNSVVELFDGTKKQIVLLDFHIPVSSINTEIVRQTLLHLQLGNGYVMNSGESYHYIHNHYLSEDDFKNILIKSLFFSPIIDRLWVAHQLLNGSATLRIGEKHGIYPTCIDYHGTQKVLCEL